MKYREITGSLMERGGKYTAIINLYDENGKRKQKSIALGIPVKGNKRKAQARLEELKQQYSDPVLQLSQARAESPLFADFLHNWLKTTAPTIEHTTYQSYESMIDARLDPFFRERCLRLCDIEPRHIRDLHESIFKDGCNANTVIHYHAVVRKALQYAVKNELIPENVADKVDRPKKGKYLAAFYSKEELAALFEATREDSMFVVIQLAAYYGLRRSEVLGIRWSAVDFDRETISINHTDHFKLLLHRHGLRHIRFHDLRHSCASLLLSQGIAMKQIQDWLGHSTFATTADIYSHLDFTSKQESAEAISAAFAPNVPEPEEAPEEDSPGFGMSMSM